MKKIILSTMLLVSASAFADSQSDVQQAKSWIKQQAGPSGYGMANGTSCNLYSTFFDNGSTIYIVVGDNSRPSNDLEGFVGVAVNAADTKISVTNNSYTFDLNASWGNKSTRNKVIIDVDGNGKPIHATGISDLQTLSCDLK